MTTIIELTRWLDKFRSSRKSVRNGSPLWAYKISDVEMHELESLLAGLAKQQSIRRVVTLYEGKYSEGFVLYVATWLQRNYTGRSKWEPVLKGIKATGLDPNDRMRLVKRGLRNWGLDVFSTDTSNRYFDTLTCQGGFPRSDLLQQSASHIMDYFEAVLSRYERYQHSTSLEDLAEESLSILPITLRQRAFAKLVTRLIDCLLEWKSYYDLGLYKDAVKVLDNENRNWRQELPFLVLDEEAQTLINKLLKRASCFKRREMNPIRVKRQLIPIGDDYRLTADLYIAKEIHPEDLARQLGGYTLPSAFLLSTQTCDGNRFRTASFTLRTGANSGWQVASYYTEVKNNVAAGELTFSIDSDGCHILDGTYYRGEALDQSMPWVFERSGMTMNYLGQGSIKSNKDSLIVVSSTKPTEANAIARVIDDGALIGSDLRVYEVFGEVGVQGISGHYQIRSNAGESEDFKVTIDTPEYVDVQAKVPVYRGLPEISFRQLDEKAVIPTEELYWFQKGTIDAGFIPANEALGAGVLVWKRGNTVLWERKCIVLPEMFEYRLNYSGGIEFSLILRNALRPNVGMLPGYENWMKTPPRFEGDDVCVDLVAKDAKSEPVGISLLWNDIQATESELSIPVAMNIASLTDRKGNLYHELERGHLTINDLPNLQLLIRTHHNIHEVQLVVDLFGKRWENGDEGLIMGDHHQVTVDCVNGITKIKGIELASIASKLFDLTDQLESYMRVRIFAEGAEIASTIPAIKRYKHALKFVDDYTAVTLNPTPTLLSMEEPVLNLSPIWDFEREPIEISPVDKTANVWRFELPSPGDVEYGGWLLWADAQMSIHPRLKNYSVPVRELDPKKLGTMGAQLLSALNQESDDENMYKETLKEGSLAYKVKYLSPEDPSSLASLNKTIRNLGYDIDHLGWPYLDGVIKRINSVDPLALYAMTSLQRNMRTLTSLLFRYKDRFNDMWDLAPRLGLSWYSVPPAIWVEVIKIYYERFQAEAEPLKTISDETYWDFVYRRFEPFEAKGIYFKYLLDLATDRLGFEPVAIWDDEYIRENNFSDQTVAHIFIRERTALMDRHKGKLLHRIGTKKTSSHFLDSINYFWPTEELPSELRGFIKYTEAEPSSYRTKQDAWTMTMALPLKLGFCLSGFYHLPRKQHTKLMLSQALSRLDEFDREWLQRVLVIAHMACDLLKLEEQNLPDIETIA